MCSSWLRNEPRLRSESSETNLEDADEVDADRKKAASRWSEKDVLPLLIALLLTLTAMLAVATNSRVQDPSLYNLLSIVLWKNATVRPPVMLFFVVAGWAWVVRLCRSRGMNVELVLGGKLQPAAATYHASLSLLCMLLLSHLVHLVASETTVDGHGLAWRPWFTCNVMLIVAVLLLGALPARAFYADARFSLLRALGESVAQPVEMPSARSEDRAPSARPAAPRAQAAPAPQAAPKSEDVAVFTRSP
jgi:hypothetical protein